MTTTHSPEFDGEKAETKRSRAERPDLTTLTDAELLARARSARSPCCASCSRATRSRRRARAWRPASCSPSAQAIGDPTVPMKLVSGIGEVDSAEASYALWDLSRQVAASAELTAAFDAGVAGLLERLRASGRRDAAAFLAAWDAFVLEHGSRGPAEWEMAARPWETKPAIALAALDRIRLPAGRGVARRSATPARRPSVKSRWPRCGPRCRRWATRSWPGSSRRHWSPPTSWPSASARRPNIIRIVHEGRMCFRELGRRTPPPATSPTPSTCSCCSTPSSTPSWPTRRRSGQTLADRFSRLAGAVGPGAAVLHRRRPRAAAVARGPARARRPRRSWRWATSIQGVPGCPGVVTGAGPGSSSTPTDPGALEPGDVLVAPPPTRRGRRCSCRPLPSWSTWARRSATRSS